MALGEIEEPPPSGGDAIPTVASGRISKRLPFPLFSRQMGIGAASVIGAAVVGKIASSLLRPPRR